MLTASAWGGVVLCTLLLGAVWSLWRRAPQRSPKARRALRFAALFLALVGALSIAPTTYAFWYLYRPWPSEFERTVVPGITVERRTTWRPRPLVIHVARVELDTPGLEVVTFPRSAGGGTRARTVRDFAQAFELDLAVNANFFDPFHSRAPWDYAPRSGDPVDPLGAAASDGESYGRGRFHGSTLTFDRQGRARVEHPDTDALWDAIAGRHILVEGGRVARDIGGGSRAPRTAAGLDRTGTVLWLVTVDGRQPNYSEGMDLLELARLLRDLGAEIAIELDGGGSTTMVARNEDGDLSVLNCPIHTRLPCRERPVGNAVGFAVRVRNEP